MRKKAMTRLREYHLWLRGESRSQAFVYFVMSVCELTATDGARRPVAPVRDGAVRVGHGGPAGGLGGRVGEGADGAERAGA